MPKPPSLASNPGTRRPETALPATLPTPFEQVTGVAAQQAATGAGQLSQELLGQAGTGTKQVGREVLEQLETGTEKVMAIESESTTSHLFNRSEKSARDANAGTGGSGQSRGVARIDGRRFTLPWTAQRVRARLMLVPNGAPMAHRHQMSRIQGTVRGSRLPGARGWRNV